MLESARNSIGTVLLSGGYAAEAIPYLEKEKAFHSRCNLASAYRQCNRFSESLSLVTELLHTDPDATYLWNTRGNLHIDFGEFTAAEECFSKALQLCQKQGCDPFQPPFVNYAFAYATCVMRRGEFEAAWPCWENGRIYRSWHPLCRVYTGEPVTDPILVITEGGYGDLFLFARYFDTLPDIAPQKHVLASWPGTLRICHKLYPKMDTVSRNVDIDRKVIACISNMSLMAVTGTKSWSDIPKPTLPRSSFRHGLPRKGICWAAEERGDQRNNRTIPIKDLAPLQNFGDWVSLVPNSRPHTPNWIIDPDLRDWTDTYDLISNLDLVVTVDTAVAHLSCALGIPTIILVPLCSDWKWGLESDFGVRSPWHDCATVVRNRDISDWDQAIAVACKWVEAMK